MEGNGYTSGAVVYKTCVDGEFASMMGVLLDVCLCLYCVFSRAAKGAYPGLPAVVSARPVLRYYTVRSIRKILFRLCPSVFGLGLF